jgi:basic membrane protein A
VLNGYSNSFDVTSKCRAIALGQIASGASAIFQVADACGLGALAAARERGVWGIGVDVDESHLGPQILTSVVKRVDVAVFDISSSFRRHRLRTGTDAVFDLANGGVALGKISPKVPPAFVRRLDPIRAAIVAGRIKVPARL